MENFFSKLRAANKEFEAASVAQKRVMIAKDVIRALDVRAMVATKGMYVGPQVYDAMPHGSRYSREHSLQDTLEKVEGCQVCAKGALFLCLVGRRNQVTHNELANVTFDSYDLQERMDGIFSAEQLRDIEAAFEGWTSEPWEQKRRTAPAARLRAIMENIVRNNGRFIPNQYGGVTVTVELSPSEAREQLIAFGLAQR